MGSPKHPLFSGATFGLMSGEKPLFQPQVEGGHEELGRQLQAMGLHAEPTSGRYKEPERSYIIHNPSLEQMQQLGKLFGQESVVHSQNGQHRLVYVNGEHEGKFHPAEAQNPIEHFEQPPPDFYTSIPGQGHVRINFDFNQTHPLNPINKREYTPDEAAYLLKGAVERLVKGWPKSAEENDENAAANFVAQDHLMESGFTNRQDHTAGNPATTLAGFRGGPYTDPRAWEAHVANTRQLDRDGWRGEKFGHYEPSEPGLNPQVPVKGTRRNKFIEKTFWHPLSYDWHDGHTGHHEQDFAAPQTIPQLKKHGEPAHPHMDGPPSNDQAAGAGVSTYKKYALPYGNVQPGNGKNLLHYPYHGKLPEIEKLVQDHGYKTYYAGGKYGKPDLNAKNYNTGHLMVYDPTPKSGGDFQDEHYTKGWRQIHELSHALTYPELNKIYGEGRRIGKLGTHRTMNEALRAVHWEWLAAHKQRELSKQIGVPVKDEDFHRELNTVMHDAIHRAVTGKFTEPGDEGFVPHAHKVPLHTALQMVRDAGHEMGLKGLHETLSKPMKKSEDLKKGYTHHFADSGRYVSSADLDGHVLHWEPHEGPKEYLGRFKGKKAFDQMLAASMEHLKSKKTSTGNRLSPVSGGGKSSEPAKGHLKVVKADLPSSSTSAPAMHGTVEGFMTGLKSLPKGSADRGKFITSHMNHAPFISALQSHPQGKSIHAMLTQHLNGQQNAGFKPGQTVAVAKKEAIFSAVKGDTVGDQKYTVEEAQQMLMKHARIQIEVFEKEIAALRSRELKKALIPSHKHNQASQASSGVEDVPPGKADGKGIDKGEDEGSETRVCAHCEKTVPAKKGHSCPEQTKWLKDNAEATKAGKKGIPLKEGDGVAKADPSMSSGTGAPAMAMSEKCTKCGDMHEAVKKCGEMTKADLVSEKGKRTDNHTVPSAKLPDDAKSKQVNEGTAKNPASGGIKLPGSNLKKATPPMAKPPSGQNMGTKVPTSAPKAPAMKSEELEKVGLPASPKAQAQQHALHVGSKAVSPAGAPAPVKLPGQEVQAQRAQGFQAAAAGAFEPKGPVSSGLELAPKPKVGLASPKAAGATRTAAAPVRPGIFGKLFGKAEAPASKPKK